MKKKFKIVIRFIIEDFLKIFNSVFNDKSFKTTPKSFKLRSKSANAKNIQQKEHTDKNGNYVDQLLVFF